MKVTYFYRNHKVGYSIKKVSDLYVNQMEDKEVFEMPSQYASIKSILKNMWYTFRHRNKKGLNHITGDIHYCIIPLMFCKTILTIHDTSAYDCAKGIKKIIIKYLWFKLPLLLANKIICISETTKQSILRFTKRSDISVIYNAISPNYQYNAKKFNEKCPNILVIGTSWNKNIKRTTEALKGINCHITIIGNLNQEQIATFKTTKISYTNKYNLTDEEIIEEYKKADIVSFCSIFEGFGMPIIEANAIGRPILTSNIYPLIEIGGDSAFYTDPYNTNEIRKSFKCIIEDKKSREYHIKLGLKNINRFKIKEIVKQHLNIYKEL